MATTCSRAGLACILIGLGSSIDGQVVGRAATDRTQVAGVAGTVQVVLHGIVVDASGAPAAGAVVVSSAGGKAIADRNGGYRLSLDVAPDANRVHVTAAGGDGGNLLASASVEVRPGVARVEPLRLAREGACEPSWLPTFGGIPGVGGTVFALAVFDDGDGPALYVGGRLSRAGGQPVSNVAKWDGARWSDVGGGVSGTNADVRALVVFDDGNGPELYATGRFSLAGGEAAARIAKWNGSTWRPLGTGLSGFGGLALAVLDDGRGPALYVGGNFPTAGGVAANGIARWNGERWSALGTGLGNAVFALAAFDDGGGPALLAGGLFASAGGVPVSNVAKWDGSAWSDVAGGTNGAVQALAVFDDGSGAALHAAGIFSAAGGAPAANVARWDGASWSALGTGIGGPGSTVQALTVFDDGSGPALHVGGFFASAGGAPASNVAKWNGAEWSALGTGTGSSVFALAGFDDHAGTALYAGGFIECVAGRIAIGIARWDGGEWTAPAGGLDKPVFALAEHDDGAGPALYAGGYFDGTGTVKADNVVKWDGARWKPLGSGVNDLVRALASFDGGGGAALYAGGIFTQAGGVAASGIARWDGVRWEPLTAPTSANLNVLTVFDDGGGPALYAAGNFISFGGPSTTPIARFDGSSWSYLGTGVNGTVYALAPFDDSTGPSLYAGGSFTLAGGKQVKNIARWDGASWSPLGSGVSGPSSRVDAMAVFDDGTGPALFVGGVFDSAGGMPVSNLAKWDGSAWSDVGGGVSSFVDAMAVFDDGRGPALLVAGFFDSAGGVAARNIARWDGSSWTPLGSGIDGFTSALLVFNDRTGDALHVGGSFQDAGGSGDAYLAKWGCPDTNPPALLCPVSIALDDRRSNGRGEMVLFLVAATDEEDPTPRVVCDPPSGSIFLPGTTLVTCTATDFSGNQATCQFPVTIAGALRAP
jgi:hypothetical protein